MKHFIDLGRYFGYPECCIADFLKRLETFQKTSKSPKVHRKLNGSGYVPCAECAKLSRETLIANIETNRIHDQPFPKDGHRRRK